MSLPNGTPSASNVVKVAPVVTDLNIHGARYSSEALEASLTHFIFRLSNSMRTAISPVGSKAGA